jgi:hypothetical protein
MTLNRAFMPQSRKLRQLCLGIYGTIVLIISPFILKTNWHLWTVSSQSYQGIGPDVIPQLTNIKQRLQAGEGDRMQQLFPEGWFFSHIIYGYSWVNVGLTDTTQRSRAIEEVEWTLAQADSPKGIGPFSRDTQVPRGVFYLAWTNRLLGGLLKLQSPEERSRLNIDRFQAQSALLAAAYEKSPRLTLEAYPGMAWPCDQVVAMSSLALHDELFGHHYRPLIQRWVSHIQQNLDPKTQLIPHKVDAENGSIEIAARSSSQVYLLPFLMELDREFARQQYQQFRRQFVVPTLGLIPLREYPIGVPGKGDVDTGPLIFGLSATSNITSLAVAKAYDDRALFDSGLLITETLGLPWQWSGQKSYGLGQLIVIDDFLVWGKTLVPWTQQAPMVAPDRRPSLHRGVWLLGSIGLLLILWTPILRSRKQAR